MHIDLHPAFSLPLQGPPHPFHDFQHVEGDVELEQRLAPDEVVHTSDRKDAAEDQHRQQPHGESQHARHVRGRRPVRLAQKFNADAGRVRGLRFGRGAAVAGVVGLFFGLDLREACTEEAEGGERRAHDGRRRRPVAHEQIGRRHEPVCERLDQCAYVGQLW